MSSVGNQYFELRFFAPWVIEFPQVWGEVAVVGAEPAGPRVKKFDPFLVSLRHDAIGDVFSSRREQI